MGVIESVDSKPSDEDNKTLLSKNPEILEFKENKNIWITIEKRNKPVVPGPGSQSQLKMHLSLRDLIICEYKYKVMPHFIFYPALGPGEFLSLSGISFDEVLDKSKYWDKEKPLLESSELSCLHDLTDNDIIIR